MSTADEIQQLASAGTGIQRRSQLEDRLSAVAGVEECVVLIRPVTEGDGETFVAYIRPSAGRELGKLRRQVNAATLGLAGFVPVMVRRIPRLADGAVDIDALLAVPVISAEAVREQLSGHGLGHAEQLKFEMRRVEPRVPTVLVRDQDAPSAVPRGQDTAGPGPSPEAPPCAEARRTPAAADLPRALIGGAPLIRRPEDPVTVTDAIIAAAGRRYGIRVVSADRDDALTSAELFQRASRVLGGLRERGLSAGSTALLQISALEDHFAVVWACLLGGIRSLTVAVPAVGYAQRSRVLDKLVNAWEDIGSPLIITDAASAGALSRAGELYGAGTLPVASVADLARGTRCDDVHRPEPSDVALLQLTSGSTGRPKVIQITHQAIVEMALAARAANEVEPGDVTYNWLPMDHVVPNLMFHLRGVILGCEAIHSPTSYVLSDPLRWLDVLHEHMVNHSWAPNFGYKLVTDALHKAVDRRWDLSCVKTLVNAGEQCTGPVMRDLRALTEGFGLRPEAMRLSWGMAETATCIVYKTEAEPGSSRKVLKSSLTGLLETVDDVQPAGPVAEFLSMGVVDPGASLRVVDAKDTVLPERTIGRLQASSARVTPGYLNNPKANAESFTADGWFDTGDLGFVIDGELVITGRAKEQIVINGVNFYCYEMEDACGVVDGVRNGLVAAVGIPDERTGTEALGIFFVPEEESVRAEPGKFAEIAGRIRRAMAADGQFQPQYVVPLQERDFPRTTSGKLQRGQLVERFLAGEFTEVLDRLVNATAVPDCVFRPGWQMLQTTPLGNGTSPARVTVVFADEQGLADRLALSGRVIKVRSGAGFAVTDEGFLLDPSSASDWARLADWLDELNARPDLLLYLWSYLPAPGLDAPAARLRDVEARCGEYLLACYRALVAASERPPQVVTVSRGMHGITGEEELCFPAALAASISSVAAAELADVATWHVDLPGDVADGDAPALAKVLHARPALPREIAWRDGHVFVPCLDPVAEAGQPADALVRGGWYVVAGGDGGVGRHLLPDLADRYDVRFLVLSRRPAESGATVRFAAADIADMAAVRHAVAEAEAEWGTAPSGVLHLADVYRFRLLTEETEQTWRDALRAKTQGTVNLAALARECGGRLVVFASLLGWLGSAGCGAYVAGSRYAQALSEHLRAHSGLDVSCLAWGLWQATGLNQDNPYEDLVRQRGVLSLAPDQAVTLNRLVLRQPPGNYLVGLNGGAEAVRALVRSRDQLQLEYPVVVAPDGAAKAGTPLPVRDTFGVSAQVTVVAQAAGSGGIASEAAALAEAVEEAVRTVVVTGELGRQRPFLELGLSSIQVLQFHASLEQRLGRQIPPVALYEYPTIDALASHLAGDRR